MNDEAVWLIKVLELAPHPEGGYFRETFRAPRQLAAEHGGPVRNASTAIYFLLPSGSFSAFHSVRGADEVWVFVTAFGGFRQPPMPD